MRIETKSENYNKFLKRKELYLDIIHPEESTPAMAAVQQYIAKEKNAPAEKTEIKEIISARGSPTSKCIVFIWDDKTVKDLSKKEEPKDEAKEEPAAE